METTKPRWFDEVEGPDSVNVDAQRRKRYRRWNVKIRRQIAVRDHLISGNLSSEASGQKTISTPLMYVMKYVVPLVLALVILKYQGKPESLFLENPVPLWCFFAAYCVYWLILGEMKQMTTLNDKCFQIASRGALASGILSALSLLSIFVPYPISLVPLLIWIPLATVLVWPTLYHAYDLLKIGMTSVIKKIHAIVVWVTGLLNSMEEASLPM